MQQLQQPSLTQEEVMRGTSIKCEACESTVFAPVFVIKKISALLSPTGREANVPLQTFACAKCNHVNGEFMPSERVE